MKFKWPWVTRKTMEKAVELTKRERSLKKLMREQWGECDWYPELDGTLVIKIPEMMCKYDETQKALVTLRAKHHKKTSELESRNWRLSEDLKITRKELEGVSYEKLDQLGWLRDAKTQADTLTEGLEVLKGLLERRGAHIQEKTGSDVASKGWTGAYTNPKEF